MNPTTSTEQMNQTKPSLTASPHDAHSEPLAAPIHGDSPDVESDPRGRAGIGRILVGSMTAGLLTALVLAVAPFIPATEDGITGVVLLGFALGWALLAVLSVRFSDQPQRWAAAPAVFMGVGAGIVLLGADGFVHGALAWMWPPALLMLVVWMFVQAQRHLHSRSRGWVLNPVFAALAVVAVGAGVETARESLDAHAYPIPGQLVEVGGHQMHLHCTGSGSPTVVLEPGAGEMSSALGWIAPVVARDTRVCVYDRAGRGWSEPADGPQDGARIATDLHALLHRGGVPGPYVLAGHSFGGLYVRSFAAQYPDDVAGLVLVDSTPAAAEAAPNASAGAYDPLDRVSAALAAAARLGLGRAIGQFSHASLPPESRDPARASLATASHVASTADEYAAANASRRQAQALVDLAGKPLIVLTAGIGHDQQWLAAQDQMAALSTNSLHRVLTDATHASLIEREQDSAAVTRAIRDVVTSVRAATPLAAP